MRNQDKRKYSKAPGILAALLAFLVSLAFVSEQFCLRREPWEVLSAMKSAGLFPG